MDNKESNFVSAVVYLHSEDDNTYGFLQMLNTVLSENFKAYELILVDDNVAVSIIENIRRFKNDNPHVICSIISMGFKHGLEASMNAGVDLAIGDFVFEFDSCYIDYPRDLIMEIYKISLREMILSVLRLTKLVCHQSSFMPFIISIQRLRHRLQLKDFRCFLDVP